MTWEIALGIFALAAGIATIVKPIINLTNAITSLTVKVDAFSAELDKRTKDNKEAFNRLREHNDEQDDMLQNHETRIHDLEQKG